MAFCILHVCISEIIYIKQNNFNIYKILYFTISLEFRSYNKNVYMCVCTYEVYIHHTVSGKCWKLKKNKRNRED